jgi:hypothetical protein
MMRQQLEQSGILQQMPALLKRYVEIAQQRVLSTEQVVNPGRCEQRRRADAELIGSTMRLVEAASQLHPSFLTAHASGQKCLLPAMQHC